MNIERIFLVISLIFMVIMYTKMVNMEKKSLETFNNNDIVEHTTNSETMTREETLALIQQEYNYDLEAIRNLGAISKSLLTGKNYHSNDVSLSSISYTENTGELCNSSVASTVANLELAKSTCDANNNCQGFTKTVDGTFEIHNSISGFAERGAQAANSCYIKQQTEGTLENNNLIIPANLNTLGNFVVEGTFNLLPAGCIIMWGQEEIPNGWKRCDGTGTYTTVDGITKNIPDLIGRFVLAAGQGAGLTNRTLNESGPENGIEGDDDTGVRNGGEVHKLTVAQMPRHTHTSNYDGVRMPEYNGSGWRGNQGDTAPAVRAGFRINATGGSQAHNNMPPYYVLFYIIKVY